MPSIQDVPASPLDGADQVPNVSIGDVAHKFIDLIVTVFKFVLSVAHVIDGYALDHPFIMGISLVSVSLSGVLMSASKLGWDLFVYALSLFGFTRAGVRSGSYAASTQSLLYGGNVYADSWFAYSQAIGATEDSEEQEFPTWLRMLNWLVAIYGVFILI
ncbi:hypothetical protein BV25DRAFT_1818055, partial [Artomyces pyxidatus]